MNKLKILMTMNLIRIDLTFWKQLILISEGNLINMLIKLERKTTMKNKLLSDLILLPKKSKINKCKLLHRNISLKSCGKSK